MSARAETYKPKGGVLARLAWAAALIALLGVFAPAVFTPAEAAACDRSYCQRGGCVSSDQIRQKARRAFKNWRILSVRLMPGGPQPSCLIYEVKLKGPGGASQIARWHVNGARAR